MPESVRVRVLNVGQGDAIVGTLPDSDRAFVVDVYDADRVLDFLAEEGISEVVLFLSHSDKDHTAGASDFLAEFPRNGRILGILYNHDRLNARKDSEYVRLTRLIGEFSRSARRTDPNYLYTNFNTNLNRHRPFLSLFPGRCSLRVLHPEQADQSSLIGQDTNETAGVLMVESRTGQGESQRMLLPADVQLTGISLMLDREPDQSLQADVLKFPHHGAWPEEWPGISFVGVEKRTLQDFLAAVSPSTVIISAGFENQHGHVRQEVFQLLETYHGETGRLSAVKCTQFTATCLKRSALPDGGLLHTPHCAGDIEVRFGSGSDGDGFEVLTSPAEHLDRVAELHRGGRARCAFLPQVEAALSSHGR